MNRINVIYKKLGRHKVYGYANLGDNEVELDIRLTSKKHLEILVHECLHILFPELEEDEIIEKSIKLVNTLWLEQYRRVETHNDTPLQDGSF